MSAPFQLELLTENRSPLFGLHVKFDGDRSCPHCRNKIATIGRSIGPHFGELLCGNCGSHCGWLSKSAAAWIETVIKKFGAPSTIVLRRSSP